MVIEPFSCISGAAELSQRGAWVPHTPCEALVPARGGESNISFEGGSGWL